MTDPSSGHFRPLPLLGNPHVQTVLGSLLGKNFRGASRPHPLPLPDGDHLVLHDSIPSDWQPGGPIALLIHGLSGSHRSSYIQRLTRRLLPLGLRVVRVDLRGAGHGARLARLPYHAGCSDDLRIACAEIQRWSPTSPLVVVGFSLGGNVTLKLAGESASEPVANLAAAAAVGPPIDLYKCVQLLLQPRNRFYERHFLSELLTAVRLRERYFRDMPRAQFPRQMTLQLFDELYTAPRCGFAGALDYYERASSVSLIPKIQVPTLILTARDDPFICVDPFETLAPMPNVELHILERGGHLGFLGWDGAGSIYWGERRVVEWIARQVGR